MCRALIPRVHQFESQTIKYRTYNEASEEKFKKLLLEQDWELVQVGTASDAAVALDSIIQAMYNQAFPLKSRKIKSTDAPWMTDRIRRAIRNRKRYYKQHGRNAVWRRKKKKIAKNDNGR